MSQTSVGFKLPQWAVPLLVLAGLALLLLLSNRPAVNPISGIEVVTNGAMYEAYSKAALEFAKGPMDRAEKGEALTERDRKDLQSAIDRYEAMNLYNPTNVEPFFMAGKAYRLLEKNDPAGERLLQAIYNCQESRRQAVAKGETQRDDIIALTEAEARAVYSEVLVEKGDYTEAEIQSREAIQIGPNNPDYRAAHAAALIQLQDLEDRQRAEQGKSVDSKRTRLKEAETELNLALSLQKDHPKSLALWKLMQLATKGS